MTAAGVGVGDGVGVEVNTGEGLGVEVGRMIMDGPEDSPLHPPPLAATIAPSSRSRAAGSNRDFRLPSPLITVSLLRAMVLLLSTQLIFDR
jgi:hypothetical protein